MQIEQLVQQYKTEVHTQANVIDPTGEQDWYSLVLGWALGKGLQPDAAHEISAHIRYKTM